jgi:2'-aminobiphenyl-2,3-diol 1,2-dioxygenase large subunit
MGRIVGSYAVTHILMSRAGCEADARKVFDGMKEIGRRLRATQPDALIVISSDHMFNINLAMQPPFAIGVADRYIPMGEMDIPRDPVVGHRSLARSMVVQAAEDGFDLAQAEEYALDHGVMVPLLFTHSRDIPVVPVIVNIQTDPIPSARRCLELARSFRRAIETRRPAAERVGVIGTGGLSHWLCVPRHGEVSTAFDRMVIDRLAAGDAEALVELGNAAIIEQGGNGGIEILTWIMAAAMAGGGAGEEVFYQPMPQWFTGLGGMAFHV